MARRWAEPRQVTVELNQFLPRPLPKRSQTNTVLIHRSSPARMKQQLSTPGQLQTYENLPLIKAFRTKLCASPTVWTD